MKAGTINIVTEADGTRTARLQVQVHDSCHHPRLFFQLNDYGYCGRLRRMLNVGPEEINNAVST